MTDKEMLTRELEHLVKMAETSSTWAEYATWKARAQELAAADKDCAHLPGAVLEEYRRLRKPTSSVTEVSGMPAEQPNQAGS